MIAQTKEKVKETVEEFEEQIEKVALFFRARLGLPLHDEERGVLIQPGKLEERTRVKNVQVIVHTYLRMLHKATGFNIYGDMVEEFDRYLISLDGLGRTEYIADRQPKVVSPMPSVTSVNLQQPQEKDGKEGKKK